jgi:hypothetical protein
VTPKPLRVAVTDRHLGASAELDAWREKGHTVEVIDLPYDLVLGPNAWHLTAAHLPYLDLAEKAARKRVYPAKKGS